MTARTAPPGEDRAPNRQAGRGAGVEQLGGGRTVVETLPRPADEFRDLAREMVAAIEAAADRDMICGCDTIDVVADHDACWQGFLGDIANNARRLLWLAELDGGSR